MIMFESFAPPTFLVLVPFGFTVLFANVLTFVNKRALCFSTITLLLCFPSFATVNANVTLKSKHTNRNDLFILRQ